MAIPDFSNNDYYLPLGMHKCNIEDIENQLLFSERRVKVWRLFCNFAYRLYTLGILPDKVIINGSFVTARENPGDVDFVLLIRPETIETAIEQMEDEHDKRGIEQLFTEANIDPIRDMMGVHFFVAINNEQLSTWSNMFQYNVRQPDPNRDPPWVTSPHGKGILILDGGELFNAIGSKP